MDNSGTYGGKRAIHLGRGEQLTWQDAVTINTAKTENRSSWRRARALAMKARRMLQRRSTVEQCKTRAPRLDYKKDAVKCKYGRSGEECVEDGLHLDVSRKQILN